MASNSYPKHMSKPTSILNMPLCPNPITCPPPPFFSFLRVYSSLLHFCMHLASLHQIPYSNTFTCHPHTSPFELFLIPSNLFPRIPCLFLQPKPLKEASPTCYFPSMHPFLFPHRPTATPITKRDVHTVLTRLFRISRARTFHSPKTTSTNPHPTMHFSPPDLHAESRIAK